MGRLLIVLERSLLRSYVSLNLILSFLQTLLEKVATCIRITFPLNKSEVPMYK